MKQSAGILLYRQVSAGWEVLLVHPSGQESAQAMEHSQGEPEADEPLEAAARRETWEETGVAVAGELMPLGSIDYSKSKKRVHAFAAAAPADAAPRCASWEVDQACFLPLTRARELLHPEQCAFLDRFEEWLSRKESPDRTAGP